ncbi:hypothetical protein C3F00_026725 [Pseudomonas sp. MWU13-2860]|nr:hypothetical protein C3F00_026725 [Pseudomonas sp. MWU13-2860]
MVRMKLDFSADPPDIEDALANLIGHYGFRAMKIAESLRKKYSIHGEDLVLRVKGRVVNMALEMASDRVRKFLVSVD